MGANFYIVVTINTNDMKGRPNLYHENDLILSAQSVFWEKGYSATSLSDLRAATGAGAGSLYNTFRGGKKELFKRALQQRRNELIDFKASLEASADPISLLREFFLDLANSDGQAHNRGCLIANTLVEMSFVDDELADEAKTILKETEAFYTTVIRSAQRKGTIKSEVPASVLGKYLITLWCGINSLRRMYPEKEILEQLVSRCGHRCTVCRLYKNGRCGTITFEFI